MSAPGCAFQSTYLLEAGVRHRNGAGAAAVTRNPSLKRTRTGMPFLAFISFRVLCALPARSA
jgi:hypothetical protein